jgi:hypothetical protein
MMLLISKSFVFLNGFGGDFMGFMRSKYRGRAGRAGQVSLQLSAAPGF